MPDARQGPRESPASRHPMGRDSREALENVALKCPKLRVWKQMPHAQCCLCNQRNWTKLWICLNISAAWGGGSGVFGIFFDFFGPGPLKNASEKIALRSFCPDFRAEISHGEPNRARDNFPEKCRKWYVFVFTKLRFQYVLKKSISYKTPEPRTKTKNDRNWII